MKNKANILSILLAVAFLAPAFGQQEEEGELTIEELYLQNAEIRIIREQAITQDRDMKLSALENIEEMLEEGELTGETSAREAHYILDYLAGEGLTRLIRENNRLVNYYPEVRRRAVSLLGDLATDEARESLVNILLVEEEPMVLAETAFALGKIGDNEDNRVSRPLASVVLSQDAIGPDNNFAFASLLAFEKIAEQNSGLNDPMALDAIIRIAQGSYLRSVKLKAVEVLDTLRQY